MLMKKFARIFASSLLRTTLFSAAITAAMVSVLGSPATIKKSLNDSKIYDSLVGNVLQEAAKQAAEKGEQDSGDVLNQPAVQQAAKTALDPATLHQPCQHRICKTGLPGYGHGH